MFIAQEMLIANCSKTIAFQAHCEDAIIDLLEQQQLVIFGQLPIRT